MAPNEGIPVRPQSGRRALDWFKACVGLLAIAVSVVLAGGGHAAAAATVGTIGAAIADGGSTRITVNIRRRQ
ncbi:hypothetical protein ACIGQE_28090 [Streptomyces sp. NPDC053429]|uniref:hypothetical protein n=1 Tax=unclassified Streptomyces TaxID=2593676 RepID=UPI0033CD8B63